MVSQTSRVFCIILIFLHYRCRKNMGKGTASGASYAHCLTWVPQTWNSRWPPKNQWTFCVNLGMFMYKFLSSQLSIFFNYCSGSDPTVSQSVIWKSRVAIHQRVSFWAWVKCKYQVSDRCLSWFWAVIVFSWWYAHLRCVVHPPAFAFSQFQI